jgi:hypothetical protein
LGALRSLQSINNLWVKHTHQIALLSHEEKAQWMKYNVDRETTKGGMQVDDAETTIRQGQEDMSNASKKPLRTKMPEKYFGI